MATTPISTVLVANRGEIARRVFRTCRARGLGTVAVYSDADAGAPHVTDADRAVRLPGTSAAETYLDGPAVVAAALRAGADAVHPGYGFLSENAGFARAVQEAGLVWVGPPPEAIALMGSKIESKAVMDRAGVPVLPRLDPDRIGAADLPVIVKASAGGGGRGMRVVTDLADLEAALAGAAHEARSAFGDGAVFCERYVPAGRHVEVQVVGDAAGTVWALGERECSIQRRHQKVVEEAPSPLVDRLGPHVRAELLEAGRRAAAAIGYVGAGTVEFLAEEDGRFSFLEMNTRLQVEHPVTENVTGVDLVGLQLDVADGLRLPEVEPVVTGHSIEARLYAEDPLHDWRPRSGVLARIVVPGVAAEFEAVTGRGVRLDSGVVDGSAVPVHYDPMLAKVTATAPTRTEAARLLAATLRRSEVHGVGTNRDLLVGVLTDPEFLAGGIDTAFFDRHPPAELARGAAGDPVLGAVAAALADAAESRRAAGVGGSLPGGWRNLPGVPQRRTYVVDGTEVEVAYRWTRDGTTVESPANGDLEVVAVEPTHVVLCRDGVTLHVTVARLGSRREVLTPDGAVTLEEVPRFAEPSDRVATGALVAPMPGVVSRVAVSVGEEVAAGQPLLWLEAMKMEHVVAAPGPGSVRRVAEPGDQVRMGAVLVVVEPPDEGAPEEDR